MVVTVLPGRRKMATDFRHLCGTHVELVSAHFGVTPEAGTFLSAIKTTQRVAIGDNTVIFTRLQLADIPYTLYIAACGGPRRSSEGQPPPAPARTVSVCVSCSLCSCCVVHRRSCLFVLRTGRRAALGARPGLLSPHRSCVISTQNDAAAKDCKIH